MATLHLVICTFYMQKSMGLILNSLSILELMCGTLVATAGRLLSRAGWILFPFVTSLLNDPKCSGWWVRG